MAERKKPFGTARTASGQASRRTGTGTGAAFGVGAGSAGARALSARLRSIHAFCLAIFKSCIGLLRCAPSQVGRELLLLGMQDSRAAPARASSTPQIARASSADQR